MRSLDIGATGMLAQQIHVDVISNNIANMTTTGFKRQRPEFQDLMYQNIQRPGSTSSDVGTILPTGIQIGLGTKVNSIYRMHGQGSMKVTDNSLDLAINGEGYFMIDLPSGETAYTRAGSFALNDQGELVTAQGYTVQPGISIPSDAESITVNESGEIIVSIPNQVASQNVGQIQLATFLNPGGLEAVGDTLFLETDASGSATTGTPASDNFGTILQGTLESSNVNVVEEITNLISAQRAYEMNSKTISASDQMLSTVSQLR